MSEEFESSVNAETAEIVEPQVVETVQSESSESVNEEVTTSQTEKPVQSQEENAKYAAIRRESETKTRDRMISEMYGNSHGIHTYADYQGAIEAERVRAEAETKGHDPELYARLSSAEQKLSNYEREKLHMTQEQTLSSKPYYNEWKDEVKDIANMYNSDYATAYTLLAEKKMPEIIANYETKLKSAKENAVKEYLAAKTRPQGTVEGTGQTPVITATAPKSFADAKKQSMELLNLQFRKE